MTNDLESSTSIPSRTESTAPPGWLRLGVVAAASAVVGGLAAAWWYKKTLTQLQQAEMSPQNPEIRNSEEDFSEEG